MCAEGLAATHRISHGICCCNGCISAKEKSFLTLCIIKVDVFVIPTMTASVPVKMYLKIDETQLSKCKLVNVERRFSVQCFEFI